MGYAVLNIAYDDYEIVSIVSKLNDGFVTMYGKYGNNYVIYLAGTNGAETVRLYANASFNVDVYYCKRGTIPLISN